MAYLSHRQIRALIRRSAKVLNRLTEAQLMIVPPVHPQYFALADAVADLRLLLMWRDWSALDRLCTLLEGMGNEFEYERQKVYLIIFGPPQRKALQAMQAIYEGVEP